MEKQTKFLLGMAIGLGALYLYYFTTWFTGTTILIDAKPRALPRESTELLNEIAKAQVCLLNAEYKELYDQTLPTGIALVPLAGEEALPVVVPVTDPVVIEWHLMRGNQTFGPIPPAPPCSPMAATKSSGTSGSSRRRCLTPGWSWPTPRAESPAS